MDVGPTLGGVKSIILDPGLFQSGLGYEFLTKYSTDSMSDLGLTCIACKDQLISKGLFGVANSPKNELKNSNFCPSLLGQKFFVHFLGELNKTEFPFEIN